MLIIVTIGKRTKKVFFLRMERNIRKARKTTVASKSHFEGYISMGDLNNNGLIDAYDISAVATRMESGVSSRQVPSVASEITVAPAKNTYNEGETVEIRVSGKGLRSVNALSFALPYDPQALEYVETEATGMKEMRNLTNDRLHTNGTKALYPTFVNIGEKAYLEGDAELMTIKFKAKRKQKIDLKVLDGMLVDKNMNSVKF